MPKRVAIYCRVSTTEQHVDGQLHALRAYAEARGLEVAGEFIDHGISGAKGPQALAGQAHRGCPKATLRRPGGDEARPARAERAAFDHDGGRAGGFGTARARVSRPPAAAASAWAAPRPSAARTASRLSTGSAKGLRSRRSRGSWESPCPQSACMQSGSGKVCGLTRGINPRAWQSVRHFWLRRVRAGRWRPAQPHGQPRRPRSSRPPRRFALPHHFYRSRP